MSDLVGNPEDWFSPDEEAHIAFEFFTYRFNSSSSYHKNRLGHHRGPRH